MKMSLLRSPGGKPMAACSVLLFSISATRLATAAPLQEARVSQVIQDVRLLQAHGAPRTAVVNDKITLERAVHTGKESRAELTFTDLTITRLGANTIFSLKAGAREVDLTSGTILLAVPTGAAPVKANTTAVTAAVTGGTALLAAGPPTKFMVLEGIGTIYPKGHPEKTVTVHAGEMVVVTADGRMTQPEQFDVRLVLETSLLITDFPPLPNLPLILEVVNLQLAERQLFGIATRLFPWDWFDLLDLPDLNANANPILIAARGLTPTPTPPPPVTPTPSKTGTPSTISSPNPYLITSGTVIKTDPSITTNGVTDFGKIYRGPASDGPFSLWAFGSTSAFDNALGFDALLADVGNLPIAAFKFQSLLLTGNPTIDLSNGGVTKLGLIGVDGITSGPPGGTLTFTGLDLLLLATVNGSINLTSDVSFQGIPALAMYARGAGSNLILDSPISNVGVLALAAEGSIHLTNPGTMSVGQLGAMAGGNLTLDIGGSLILNGSVNLETLVLPDTTVASGANIALNITGNYTNNSTTDSSRLRVRNEGAHIGTGGNIEVNIGGNLTAMNDFDLIVENTNGQIDHGGNIALVVNGSISTSGELNLLVENYNETANPAGHIGTGGNVSLTTGGDLTADFASIAINNRGGGVIGSGVILAINIGGALTTSENGPNFLGNSASLSLEISNRYDNNTAGSSIGGDADLLFHSDSASIGGLLDVAISDRGGTIAGNALLNFSATHDIRVQENAAWEILNDSGDAAHADSPVGGTIHGSAALLLTATNLTVTAGSLNVDILNKNGGVPGSGGTIDSDAAIIVDLSGDFSIAGDASFSIANQNEGGTNGGEIGGDAAINVGAANISTGSGLEATIDNTSGSIGGNALITFGISGNANIAGDATFQILNSDNGTGGSPGHIGGNAIIGVSSGGDFSANSLTGFINDRHAGSIGASAAVAFDIAGALSTTNDVFVGISTRNDGTGGGTIGSDATVGLTAGSISVGGAFTTFVSTNGGGSIMGDALNQVVATGDLMAQGPILVDIQDTGFNQINPTNFIAGGHIGGDASVMLAAQNITTFSTAFGNPDIDIMALAAAIDTSGQGTIGGNAIVNVLASQNISAPGSVLFRIANGNYLGFGAGTIGGNAEVNVSAASLSTGDLLADILNYGGASIGRDAIISLDLSNSFTATGDARFRIFSPGGTISQNAEINVRAGDISVPSLTAEINDSNNGSIGGNATISVQAGSIETMSTPTDVDVEINNYNSGTIQGDAIINFAASGGNINTNGNAVFLIVNEDQGAGGGTIGSNAEINVSGSSITTGGGFFPQIQNDTRGNITGNAEINIDASADITIQSSNARILVVNSVGGSIGGNATVDVNLGGDLRSPTGDTFLGIFNSIGGTIGGDATINARAVNISAGALLRAYISNFGGQIGGDATINLNAGSVSANSLLSQINNNGGGSIGANTEGGATINMNVSGTAAVTNDATVAIYGSDGTGGGAAININGGNYDVGGTFLSYIDGDGRITFSNAIAHADVLKAGVFGANGVLNIGGGMLSADTELKLYAPGSNGHLNFVSDVTLGGNSLKILAADSVTIFNNVVVTIGGTLPADVYTNHPNYKGFGGNGTTTGTFAGAGANRPQPLANAPPFGPVPPPTLPHGQTRLSQAPQFRAPSPGTITTVRNTTTPKAINISNTNELLSLLDNGYREAGGKITIPGSKPVSQRAHDLRNSSRLNTNRELRTSRTTVDIRRVASLRPGRLAQ